MTNDASIIMGATDIECICDGIIYHEEATAVEDMDTEHGQRLACSPDEKPIWTQFAKEFSIVQWMPE